MRAAVTALCGLASMTSELRAALGRNKCCPLIVECSRNHHADEYILLGSCEAAMHLSLHGANAAEFVDCGGCEMLSTALDSVLLEKDCGPEVCCGAMLNIANNAGPKGSIAEISVKVKLINSGAIETLKKVGFSSRATQRARECAKELLFLIQDYDEQTERMMQSDLSRRDPAPSVQQRKDSGFLLVVDDEEEDDEEEDETLEKRSSAKPKRKAKDFEL